MPNWKRLLSITALLGLSLGFACGESAPHSARTPRPLWPPRKNPRRRRSRRRANGKARRRVRSRFRQEDRDCPLRPPYGRLQPPGPRGDRSRQEIGWTPTVFDGQADTGKQLAAINAAVDGKYDAIIVILIDPIQVNEGIREPSPPKFPS